MTQYEMARKRLENIAARPWAYGFTQEGADKRLADFKADTECTGLIGDPNHQGAHCTCRY